MVWRPQTRSHSDSRSFAANPGHTARIGVGHNATAVEVVHVPKTAGMDHAFNLDDGGPTALWSGEDPVEPGRNIPKARLFVRK